MQPTVIPVSVPPVTGSPPSVDEKTLEEQEKKECLERYASPEFTKQLLEHMHAARLAALRAHEERKE